MTFLKHNKLLCFLFVAVLVAGFSLIVVSQKVYEAERSVNQMGQQVLTDEWEIRSLKAELAFLTRPDRLEQISSALLSSVAPSAGQMMPVIAPVSFSLPDNMASDVTVYPVKKPYIVKVSSPAVDVVEKDVKPSKSFADMLNQVGGIKN